MSPAVFLHKYLDDKLPELSNWHGNLLVIYSIYSQILVTIHLSKITKFSIKHWKDFALEKLRPDLDCSRIIRTYFLAQRDFL